MKRITIIGGGASGTLLAINLLKQTSRERIQVNLVEKRPSVGGGVAFSTVEETHLLNVPAAKMGAFPDEISHFHEWLTANGHRYEHDAFVPRRLFSEYLRDCLQNAERTREKNVRLNIFDNEAIGIEIRDTKAEVSLKSGEVLYSEKVVLAFGNFLPPHPSVSNTDFTRSPKYFQDPWDSAVFNSIDKYDRIFIVGTGLSMVDVATHLASLGHRGEINAISTRGLLPAVHKLGFTYPPFTDELEGSIKITDLMRVVRRHARAATDNESDWRAVIDSLRPATQKIWLGLPIAEKKYFMQHLSRYWNVARHRMPPEAAATIDKLRGSGQLNILKGRLRTIDESPSGAFLIRYSNNELIHDIEADAIVNCIGSESRFDQIDSPLVKGMLAERHIRVDDLRFGLDAMPDGRLIGVDGEPSEVLYTLGTALKGILWESTAIPEIRSQAHQLARVLIASPF
jgi:uncharacterized NAD(P)/FAD-binding protein YdhS